MADTRPDESLGPEALLMQRQTVERVRRAVEQLPVDFREVVVLRDVEGLSYEEVAATLEISVGTVKSRLSRGRMELRRRLEGFR